MGGVEMVLVQLQNELELIVVEGSEFAKFRFELCHRVDVRSRLCVQSGITRINCFVRGHKRTLVRSLFRIRGRIGGHAFA